jgi:NAD(P)-dependent dehydrogenase (short-subunit alcohol dehydrogenase family)
MATQKSIFVTGAASGIGRATALRFAREGWFVGLYDVNEAGVAELRKEIGEARSTAGRLDVRDLDELRARVADFDRACGRMDVLFNNAGILEMGKFDAISPERTRRMMDVNMLGVVNGVYAALPLLRRTSGSMILNMSSASAIYGIPELAAYSASKFFVRGLTEALDLELGKEGIRVADIMPSYVATPMVSSQTYQAGTLRTMGVKLTAEKVAEQAWRAVNARRGLHFIPQVDVKILRRVAGLLPEVARVATRKLSKL